MKPHLLLLVFLLAALISTGAHASEPDLKFQWFEWPNGVVAGVALKGRWIQIRIKNNSSSEKVIVHTGEFLRIFCVEPDGSRIPLGEHPYGDERDDFSGPVKGPFTLGPGETLGISMSLELSEKEEPLVKEYPVLCTATFRDVAGTKDGVMETPTTILKAYQ